MATVHERSRGRVPLVPQLTCRRRALCLAPPDNAMKKYCVFSLAAWKARRIGEVGWDGSAAGWCRAQCGRCAPKAP